MKTLLGKKVGMTQIFTEDGVVVPFFYYLLICFIHKLSLYKLKQYIASHSHNTFRFSFCQRKFP